MITISNGQSAGYFSIDGLDYPEGSMIMKYETDISNPTEKNVSLVLANNGEVIVNSRRFNEFVGVSTESDFLDLMAQYKLFQGAGNSVSQLTVAEEVESNEYELVAADLGKAKVFSNVAGCKITGYSGTPLSGFGCRLVPYSAGPVKIGFLSNISGGVEDYYESDGGDIMIEYFGALGWKVTGPVAVWDATRGPELFPDPEFNSGGSGTLQLNESVPNEEITFAAGEMRFFSTTEDPQYMQLRVNNILTVGLQYEVKIVTTSFDGVAPLRTTSFGSVNVSTAVGTYEAILTASNVNFSLIANGDGVDVTLTSVSIKQIIT